MSDQDDRARRGAQAQQIRDGEESKLRKVLSVFGAWLTTDDDAEALKKIDHTLGTDLSGTREKARALAEPPTPADVERYRIARAELVNDRARSGIETPTGCMHRPLCIGPKCTVYGVAEVPASPALEDDGPVIIVKKPQCGMCRGKGALEYDEETKKIRPIPCPGCGTRPNKGAA